MKGHPITIVGGGLSGLTLGIQLRRSGIPVVLYESKSYPHHRVCGEFISGLPDGLLESLGIDDLFSDAERHRETGWLNRSGHVFHRFALPRPALGLSRFRLDERLARRFIELGGELRQERFTGSREGEGIVDATGRGADKSAAESRYLGLKCHFLDLPTSFDLEMHLGRGAYVGLSRIEGGAVNVCGLFPREKAVSSSSIGKEGSILMAHASAAGLDSLVDRLREATPVKASVCGTVHFVPGRQRVRRKVLAIGDALQQIPPFTGHGMAMAIESAAIAAGPLQAYASGEVVWGDARAAIDQKLSRVFRSRLRLAQGLHPFLRSGWLPGIWNALPIGREASTETLTGALWGFSPAKVGP